MATLIALALLLTATTIVIHGAGTTAWLRFMMGRFRPAEPQHRFSRRMWFVVATAAILIILHLVQITLWAVTYRWVASDVLPTFESALYFSAVTFTTLGYGDITLDSNWRLLSGFEAINGILLIGWTTAFLFAVLQKIWSVTEPEIPLSDRSP